MAIEWTDELAFGIEEIDSQHKEIFSRFESFSRSCDEGKGSEELLNLLDFLQEYTAEHFAEEELKLAEANYPDLSAQLLAHRHFMKEFADLRNLIKDESPSPEAIIKVKSTMIRWLITHIRNMDGKYVQYMASRQP